jgi:hypothetical protein
MLKSCFSFLDSTGVWTEGFTLARQMLYYQSHTISPSCSGYFGNKVLLLAKAGLDQDPPFLGYWPS